MTDDRIDLGHGHEASPFFSDDCGSEPVGLLIRHPRPDGTGACLAHVYFDLPHVRAIHPDAARWQVESLEPLTLAPSILCRICADHGYIRNGQWMPA